MKSKAKWNSVIWKNKLLMTSGEKNNQNGNLLAMVKNMACFEILWWPPDKPNFSWIIFNSCTTVGCYICKKGRFVTSCVYKEASHSKLNSQHTRLGDIRTAWKPKLHFVTPCVQLQFSYLVMATPVKKLKKNLLQRATWLL